MNPLQAASAKSTAIDTAQQVAERGAASGYCPLDADAKVPAGNLPESVGAGWVIGEYKAMDPSVTEMPAGWYAADGAEHNGFTPLNLNAGKFVKGGTEAGSGGGATHQHDAISAGTPAGSVSAIAQTEDVGTPAGAGGTMPTYAAQTHTHPAPTFSGSALGTHQHAAASSEPAYVVLKWWCYCGTGE